MTPICFACEIREIFFIFFDDLDRPICAPAIDNNILEVGVILVDDGFDCFSDERRLIELICPLQSGPSTILVWTLKEKTNGQETRA